MEHILTHVELVSSSNSFAPKPDHNMFNDSYDTLWTKCKVFPVPWLKKSYALLNRIGANEDVVSNAEFSQQQSNQLQVPNKH